MISVFRQYRHPYRQYYHLRNRSAMECMKKFNNLFIRRQYIYPFKHFDLCDNCCSILGFMAPWIIRVFWASLCPPYFLSFRRMEELRLGKYLLFADYMTFCKLFLNKLKKIFPNEAQSMVEFFRHAKFKSF